MVCVDGWKRLRAKNEERKAQNSISAKTSRLRMVRMSHQTILCINLQYLDPEVNAFCSNNIYSRDKEQSPRTVLNAAPYSKHAEEVGGGWRIWTYKSTHKPPVL